VDRPRRRRRGGLPATQAGPRGGPHGSTTTYADFDGATGGHAMRAILAAFAAVLLFGSGCGKPAQIGPDEEVHKATDALFTALTARDADLLDRCEKRLDELATAGKLPDEPRRALKKIVARARDGK